MIQYIYYMIRGLPMERIALQKMVEWNNNKRKIR